MSTVNAAPDQVRLRQAQFRDVNMNNVVAYTMLVPNEWKVEGHIEWSNDRTPYPQQKIQITAPDNSRIAFTPAMTFHYSEATQLAIDEAAASGLPLLIPRRQGEAPPKKLGEWLVSAVDKNNKHVRNVELVSDTRDKAAEQAFKQNSTGSNTTEIHLVKFTYELDGVPFTEEINLTYGRLPVAETRNMSMWSWMLFVNLNVRAPSAKFEQLKSLMYASAQSLRPVPKWWTQQQLVLMAITQRNHQIGMEEIKRRGQFYDQMSDANFAAWKKAQAVSDSQQNARINTIYEVQDFRDPNGLTVKLPIHYKNYYTDGQGNYLMTNSSLETPGSEWKPIQPVR